MTIGTPVAAGAPLFSLPNESTNIHANATVNAYGATNSGANWYLTQWNIPKLAPPFMRTASDPTSTTYHSQNASIDLTVHKAGNAVDWYEMAQDGSQSSCNNPPTSTTPNEYGVSAQSNSTPGVLSTNMTSAAIPGISDGNGAQLTRLSALRVNTSVNITRIWDDSPVARCPINQRAVVLAFYFDNWGDATHPTLMPMVKRTFCGRTRVAPSPYGR